MVSKKLEGKVAIVTGSTSGIGIGIAKIFAENGAKVVVTGRRQEKGDAVVKAITDAGGEASYFYSDIEKTESIQSLIDSAVKKYGKLDVLVNNASNVGLPDDTVENLTIEMWDAIMNSDLRSTFLTTKHVLPHLRANGSGSIINIGSTASCSGDLGAAAYSAAKAGVNLLTLSTSLQYGKENIRCNCIRPGLIVTPENDAHVPDFVKDIFIKNIEVNRYGNPADIGYMALFFASDESGYVTGQIINVDGGLNAHTPTVGQFREINKKTW